MWTAVSQSQHLSPPGTAGTNAAAAARTTSHFLVSRRLRVGRRLRVRACGNDWRVSGLQLCRCAVLLPRLHADRAQLEPRRVSAPHRCRAAGPVGCRERSSTSRAPRSLTHLCARPPPAEPRQLSPLAGKVGSGVFYLEGECVREKIVDKFVAPEHERQTGECRPAASSVKRLNALICGVDFSSKSQTSQQNIEISS